MQLHVAIFLAPAQSSYSLKIGVVATASVATYRYVGNRYSPYAGGFEVRIAFLTGLGNRKSSSQRTNGEQSQRVDGGPTLKHAALPVLRHTFPLIAR
ncbi:MAG: hypothetical protein U1E33_02770 [Rhodospirillales bacterium]